jgi:hypothetical protein
VACGGKKMVEPQTRKGKKGENTEKDTRVCMKSEKLDKKSL